MSRTGKTTGNLKLRSGPGMQFEPPLAFLEPNTELEVLGEEGADWLHVRAGGKEGYVGRKYVELGAETETKTETESESGGLHKAGDLAAPKSGGFTKRTDNLKASGSGATKVHKGVEEE
jgi:hypothetical protein